MSFSFKKIVGVSVIYLTKANTVSPVTIRRVKLKHEISGADPGFFFRMGCTRLLLYLNTNKPQIISGGGGGTHPLHPPPRSAPEY